MVLPIVGADVVDGHLLIYMELAEKGSLERLWDWLNEPTIKYVTRWLLTAVHVLENRRLMHSDIKPLNILLGADYALKLGDFGLVQRLGANGLAYGCGGTPFFMAPEVHRGEDHGLAAEYFAIGVTLACLMDRNCTFSDEFHELLRLWASDEPEKRPGIRHWLVRECLGMDRKKPVPDDCQMTAPTAAFIQCGDAANVPPLGEEREEEEKEEEEGEKEGSQPRSRSWWGSCRRCRWGKRPWSISSRRASGCWGRTASSSCWARAGTSRWKTCCSCWARPYSSSWGACCS